MDTTWATCQLEPIWQSMLRHDANLITGRHSDIRCAATIIKNQHLAVPDMLLLGRAWRAVRGGRAMSCRLPTHEQARLHGHTRLEGMIRKISTITSRQPSEGCYCMLLQGW